jgi:hypothetical protein
MSATISNQGRALRSDSSHALKHSTIVASTLIHRALDIGFPQPTGPPALGELRG